jgi:hypothetical protein
MSVRAAILTIFLCLAGSRLFSAEDALQAIHGTIAASRPRRCPTTSSYELEARRLRRRRRRLSRERLRRAADAPSPDSPWPTSSAKARTSKRKSSPRPGRFPAPALVHGARSLPAISPSRPIRVLRRAAWSASASPASVPNKLEAFTLFHIETEWVRQRCWLPAFH